MFVRLLCRVVKRAPDILPNSFGKVIAGDCSGRGKLFFSTDSTDVNIKKTSLYEFHVKNGAKMVPFAGYSMPLQYNDLSIIDSHRHTRTDVSLFDVSHMLQMEINGKDRIEFFENLVVADVKGLAVNTGCLTLYTSETGGIIDDLIVSKKPESLYVVSNASRSKEDLEHLQKQRELFLKNNPNADVSFKVLSDRSLIAFQGPKAAETLQSRTLANLNELKFMFGIETEFDGIPIRLTRCGYTGEDGFEIQVHNDQAIDLANKLIQMPAVKLAGLGARDSLRLEAGLCLYGNDMNMETTPIQAALAWTIAKRRRTEGNFLGAQVILKELNEKKSKIKRIGLKATKAGPPVRTGARIYNEKAMEEKNFIGEITSGCPSPTLGQNIAMGYVKSSWSKTGKTLYCDIRGKLYEYQVCKMPFVPAKYFM